MPQPPGLSPAAYAADRGPLGVLLLHGFTGSAAETRPLGERLAERGYTVRCPLLPGHGLDPAALALIHRRAWIAAAAAAHDDLRARCDRVFVGGLSLGSLLALALGAARPEIAGLIARYLLRDVPPPPDDLGDPAAALARVWCYDRLPVAGAAQVYLLHREVRRLLPRIRQPLLVLQGRRDRQLRPDAGPRLCAAVASADTELRWLEGSGHNLLIDGERERAWAHVETWLEEHL